MKSLTFAFLSVDNLSVKDQDHKNSILSYNFFTAFFLF